MVAGVLEPGTAARVEPPLEDVALDDERAGDLAFDPPLCLGTYVDEQCAGCRGARRLTRSDPSQPTARLDEEVIDSAVQGGGQATPTADVLSTGSLRCRTSRPRRASYVVIARSGG